VRPRLLRVKGLRSFRTEREIDFADLGLVAVVGDTGAGKSSILEAITYALYNATTWDQRGVKQLISDGATTMSVELEFGVDGHVYRIARSTSRGAYPPPSHQLECLTDPSVSPLDSEDAINAEVARLVGLDWAGFTSAVILPQGRFQTLLQATAADRTEILKGIFRLGELAEAREQARDLALGYRGPLDELREQRSALLPDPAAAAREARSRKEEAEQEERRRRALAAERTRQEKAAARKAREAERAETAAERLARANVRPARELRCLEPLLRELEAREAAVGAADADAQEHEARLAAALERAERAGEREGELSRAKAVLERLVAEAPALAVERAEQGAARREISREEAALVHLRREAAAARKVQDAVQTLSAADDVLGRLERQLGNARTIAERKAEAEEVARRRLTTAAERLEPLLRAHAAAHAAHGLEAGEECPICRRELPAGFKPPRASAVHAAQEAYDRAEAAARSAGEARAAAEGTLAHLEQAGAEAARKRAAAERTVQRLGDVDLSAPAEAAVRSRQAALEERKVGLEAATAKLADRAAALERDRAGLPKRFRPAASAGEDRRASLLAALEARLAEVQRLRREREAARARLAELRTDRDELTRRRERELEQPRRRIENAMRRIEASGVELQATAEDDPGFAEQLARAEELERAADRLAKKLAQAVADARARASTALEAAAAALAETGAADPEELEELVIEASAKRTRARDEEAEARAQIAAARDLDRRIRPLRESIEVLETVASLLTDGRFIGYVVTRRQRALLALASEILGSMTGGRYGFAEDFRIVDRAFGQARGSKTLSGGEAFLASLALAIGLVELAARGGGRLEALFLDEGFGSLDADALDDALGELERRAQAGRLVAVVSHIRAVAERIEDVLQVVQEPEGTEVTRVSGAERETFVEEEVEERLLA
jgi:DNA repair protein SbcC/Rad50